MLTNKMDFSSCVIWMDFYKINLVTNEIKLTNCVSLPGSVYIKAFRIPFATTQQKSATTTLLTMIGVSH